MINTNVIGSQTYISDNQNIHTPGWAAPQSFLQRSNSSLCRREPRITMKLPDLTSGQAASKSVWKSPGGSDLQARGFSGCRPRRGNQSTDNLIQAISAIESASEHAAGQSVSGPPAAAAVWLRVVPVPWQN